MNKVQSKTPDISGTYYRVQHRTGGSQRQFMPFLWGLHTAYEANPCHNISTTGKRSSRLCWYIVQATEDINVMAM